MSYYLSFEEPLRPLDNVIDNLSAETDITVQQKAKLQS